MSFDSLHTPSFGHPPKSFKVQSSFSTWYPVEPPNPLPAKNFPSPRIFFRRHNLSIFGYVPTLIARPIIPIRLRNPSIRHRRELISCKRLSATSPYRSIIFGNFSYLRTYFFVSSNRTPFAPYCLRTNFFPPTPSIVRPT